MTKLNEVPQIPIVVLNYAPPEYVMVEMKSELWEMGDANLEHVALILNSVANTILHRVKTGELPKATKPS